LLFLLSDSLFTKFPFTLLLFLLVAEPLSLLLLFPLFLK
jgi:hypothetical protein